MDYEWYRFEIAFDQWQKFEEEMNKRNKEQLEEMDNKAKTKL